MADGMFVVETFYDRETGEECEKCPNCETEWMADNRLKGEPCPSCGTYFIEEQNG